MNKRAPDSACTTNTLLRTVCGAAVVGGILIAGGAARAGDSSPTSTGGAVMRLHRDPNSGAILGGPSPRNPNLAAPGAERAGANPAETLTEEPAPGGGVKVKLHRHFHPAENGSPKGAPSGTADHE